MKVYTVENVERLLRSYLDFQYFLMGKGGQSMDTYSVRPSTPSTRELPFGATKNDARPWPFYETRHARIPRDGKSRAMKTQELHVSMLDIEIAIKQLQDDDLELLYKYYLFQTHTIEELCAERGIARHGTMRMRCKRAVERLVYILERPEAC